MLALDKVQTSEYAMAMSRSSVPSVPSPPCPLTRRELEILANVACGYSNRLIGQQYGIAEQTVKNHVANIMHRLNAPDRTAAVVVALRHGWLDLASMEVVRRESFRETA